MAITPPPIFENDIKGRDTNLTPLVKIGSHCLSTNDISFDGDKYLPLLDNIPSLKESIDIETRKYKISNVALNIHNFLYNGERFSDKDVKLNDTVKIYWMSPSCTSLSDCMYIYNGFVRNYKMSDTMVTLSVEDKSQQIVHVDLPKEMTEDTSYVPDKYKNEPIPMVYGHVDKSPGVIESAPLETEEGGIEAGSILIKFDSHDSTSVNTTEEGNFLVEVDEIYHHIPQSVQQENVSDIFGYESGKYIQYNYSPNGQSNAIELISEANADPDTSSLGSPLFNGTLLLNTSKENTNGLRILQLRHKTDLANHNRLIGTSILLNSDSKENIDIVGTLVHEAVDSEWDVIYGLSQLHITGESYTGIPMNFINAEDLEISEESTYSPTGLHREKTEIGLIISSDSLFQTSEVFWEIDAALYVMKHEDYTNDPWLQPQINIKYHSWTDSYEDSLYADSIPINYTWKDVITIDGIFSDPSRTSNGIILSASFKDPQNYIPLAGNLNIASLKKYEWGVIESPLSKKYYGNVYGREMIFIPGYGFQGEDPTEDTYESPNPQTIIRSVVINELGETAEHWGAETIDYYNWRHDFTVAKSIDSKKLIEEVGSASPSIPRFNYLGNFVMNNIERKYSGADLAGKEEIKEDDVIDFSYSLTPIEDVYTKIVFNYKYDYALDKFNGKYQTSILDHFDEYTYDYLNYGFTDTSLDEQVDGYISNTTLVIDDHRGKYIRNDDTAKQFADWLLLWHCNQHLKIKVTLPLKYMSVEVGDIIKFEKVLNEIIPYGIEYSEYRIVNGQARFNAFMVTSTNKQLDKVVIDCTQMHMLHSPNVTGCMDSNACNYNADAIFEDPNSCIYANGTEPGDVCDCDGMQTIDDCGVCDGDNAAMDGCGVCGGDSSSCADCAGIPNGDAGEDCFGVCGGDAELDNNGNCCQGTLDMCGTCDGDGACYIGDCGNYYSEEFCAELSLSTGSQLHHCDYCPYTVDPCPQGYDCAGECGGSLEFDECGVCGGNGITEGACDCDGNVLDCAGVCGGFSWIDSCGVCVPSGSLYTGHEDCTGVCFGDAAWDECQVCLGPGAIYECGCYDIPEGMCGCGGGQAQGDCGECVEGGCSCYPCADPYNMFYVPDALMPDPVNCEPIGEPDVCPHGLMAENFLCNVAPHRCVDGVVVSGENGVWDVTGLSVEEYPWEEIQSYCTTPGTCHHCHPAYGTPYEYGNWIFDDGGECIGEDGITYDCPVNPLEGLLVPALSGLEYEGVVNKYPIVVRNDSPACSDSDFAGGIEYWMLQNVKVMLQLDESFEADNVYAEEYFHMFNSAGDPHSLSDYWLNTSDPNYDILNEGRIHFKWSSITSPPLVDEFDTFSIQVNIKIETLNPETSEMQTIYSTDEYVDVDSIEGIMSTIRLYNIGSDVVEYFKSQEINTSQDYYFHFQVRIDTPNSDGYVVIFDKINTFTLHHTDGSEAYEVGDTNLDGAWNVLDVVTLGLCILNNNCDNVTTYDGLPVPPWVLDINGDDFHNVLDIVTLVHHILNDGE